MNPKLNDNQILNLSPCLQPVHSIPSGHHANIFSAKFLPATGDTKVVFHINIDSIKTLVKYFYTRMFFFLFLKPQVVSCSGDGILHYNDVNSHSFYGKNSFHCHTGTTYEVTISTATTQDSHHSAQPPLSTATTQHNHHSAQPSLRTATTRHSHHQHSHHSAPFISSPSNVSSEGPSSERNVIKTKDLHSIRQTPLSVHRQYTYLFIFRFVFQHCHASLPNHNLVVLR